MSVDVNMKVSQAGTHLYPSKDPVDFYLLHKMTGDLSNIDDGFQLTFLRLTCDPVIRALNFIFNE